MAPHQADARRARRMQRIVLGLLLGWVHASGQAQFEPEGGRVAMRSATTASGSTVLLPDRKGHDPLPVLVMLPFTGSDAERFFSFSEGSLSRQAQQQGYIIVVPPADIAADYSTAAAWSATLKLFSKGVAGDVDEVLQKHGGDPRRVALAGYSMGGDIAWALSQMDPQRYAGAIVIGSRASYRASGALPTLAQRGAKFFFFMGQQESPDRLNGSRAAQAALQKAGIDHRYAQGPGDHVPAPPSVMTQAVAYLFGFPPPPAVTPATALREASVESRNEPAQDEEESSQDEAVGASVEADDATEDVEDVEEEEDVEQAVEEAETVRKPGTRQ